MTISSRLICSLLFLFFACSIANAVHVSHDGRAITIDGQRKILLSGSIHYPRSTPGMWPGLIQKAKEAGLDAVETYIFWNAHEPARREYNFTGNLDFIRFLKTVQDEGLYAVLRIGPYICGEWNYGGFPAWLYNLPGCQIRTDNDVYKNEMANFTSLIVDMAKNEKLFASQGGPIILAQIENEYGNVMSAYGDSGVAYMNWAAKFAQSLKIGIPWIMCQQDNAPQPMINTCNGFYCDEFTPNNPNSPKMWTENWTGWFKNWGGQDPVRTAEDVAYSLVRFFQTGGTFQNYYMFHGGTNFANFAGGSYITTSYDYNAPLNEYGGYNQPKYDHLKEVHGVLHSLEKVLTYGNVSHIDNGNELTTSVYAFNGTSSCFFSNVNNQNDGVITYNGVNFTVPAWSVSIAPDCKNVVYNTARVNHQTTIMVKEANKAEKEPASFKWSWRPENVEKNAVEGKGEVSASKLIDQKQINDVSDYLWYMTSVNLEKDDPIWGSNMTLRVNCTGQVVHAYVNGELVGSQFATYGIYKYSFEKTIKLNPGKNQISLLSATVGLPNYGPHFDTIAMGLPGPIELVSRKGDETIVKDLSEHKWTYQAGLQGLDKDHLFDSAANSASASQWKSDNLPVDRMFTWYKTNFKAPLGDDPVALDAQGLGKGYAWVNGHNIGRYWPTSIAEDGCSLEPCDYRGEYGGSKCARGCGEPTQRYYHVPRDWMKDGDNELVLFEEFGGNPSTISFQTIRVGTACGNAYENKTMKLSCEGRPITAIKFASFGEVNGQCGSFYKGSCEASNVLSTIQKACVGKNSCSVEASESVLGATKCGAGVEKRLVVEATC